MRLIKILCLVVLLIGIQCTSISDRYPSLKSRKSLLQIMTAIESKIASKTPAEEIVKLITEYINQINAEQLNQTSLFEKQSKECEDEFHFRLNEISSATDAANKSQFQLDACNAQKNRAESDLQNVNNQIAETESYLAQLIATREQEAEAFHKSTEAYTFNSQAADEAIEILQQIWSGEATFLQLAKHANKMVMRAITIKKIHKLSPIMAALAQVATKQLIADDVLLNNVLNLLRDFRTSIESDYREVEAAEQTAIELYNSNKSRTEDFLDSLRQAKADLEVELTKLSRCVHNQTSIHSTAQAKLQRNQGLYDSAQNMCNSFKREFEAATASRNQELQLIQVIIQKMEKRYSQVSDYVKLRAFQNEFDPHQNQNVYEHSSEFEHQQGNFNASGAEGAGYERDESYEHF